MRTLRLVLCSVLFGTLFACESGTSIHHRVEVTPETAAAFSADEPGIIVLGSGRVVGVLCGQQLEEPIDLYIDQGFGCLDDELRGTEVTELAWVQPLMEGDDPEAICAQEFGEAYGGPFEAAPVEDDWIQTVGSGTWRRDVSPCGGSLRLEYTL